LNNYFAPADAVEHFHVYDYSITLDIYI